jgi:hypothetical protein
MATIELVLPEKQRNEPLSSMMTILPVLERYGILRGDTLVSRDVMRIPMPMPVSRLFVGAVDERLGRMLVSPCLFHAKT